MNFCVDIEYKGFQYQQKFRRQIFRTELILKSFE